MMAAANPAVPAAPNTPAHGPVGKGNLLPAIRTQKRWVETYRA